MNRKSLIAGNWKMNGDSALLDDMALTLEPNSTVDIALFPPFVLLDYAQSLFQGRIQLGAQNTSEQEKGAYTGEISATMLTEVGCHYVLVGHSERRQLYSESSELVAKKFAAAQGAGLTPVLCLGETLEERQANRTFEIVLAQLSAVIEQPGVTALENAVLAYEPVWAIGTGETATPEQAQAVHAHLRQHIATQETSIAQSLRILYGGSMKAENAAGLLAQPDIDGGLVGGASLKTDQFASIINEANK